MPTEAAEILAPEHIERILLRIMESERQFVLTPKILDKFGTTEGLMKIFDYSASPVSERIKLFLVEECRVYGSTFEEVAKRLGINSSTLRSAIMHSLPKLAVNLRSLLPDPYNEEVSSLVQLFLLCIMRYKDDSNIIPEEVLRRFGRIEDAMEIIYSECAWNKLTKREREVVYHRFLKLQFRYDHYNPDRDGWYHQSQDEIAKNLGVTVTTVRRALRQAMPKLVSNMDRLLEQ